MRYLKLFLLLSVAIICANSAKAKSSNPKQEKAARTTVIYAFGMSQDLADSTIYVSPIAPINGASMMSHGMLKNRQYYSEQLKKYVEETYGKTHQTAGFVYAEKRKQAERLYKRAIKKIKKSFDGINVTIETINAEQFHFKVPVIVEADASEY